MAVRASHFSEDTTLSFMKNFLKFTRGAIPESLVRSVLNKKLDGIAEVMEFELNPEETTGRLKILLAGESQPLSVFVDDYQFERQGGQATIRIGWMRSDREWLQNALERFVVGRTFQVPEDKVEMADALLG